MQTYFQLINFTFGFKADLPLFFDQINISISKPGLTCIVGKNGAGKSTLFRLLQGIVYSGEIISGTLRVGSESYNFADADDRYRLYRKSMILHQNFDTMLAPSFTGLENLNFAKIAAYPAFSLLMPSKQTELSAKFNIPLDRPVKVLSGGQRQMLAMLMVVEQSIDLLLLDEPTAALDLSNSAYIMDGLTSLIAEKNMCVLSIVHDYELVEKYAANVVKIIRNDSGLRTLQLE